MNANRKADLQRKLALAPVPKPPAGLVERIKREIPKQLRFDAEQERVRLSKSVAFSMRVAASILLVVSGAYLALQMLTRVEQRRQPAAVSEGSPTPAAIAAPDRSAPQRENAPAKVAKKKPKPQVLMAEAKEEVAAPAAAPPPPTQAKVRTAALSGIELRDQGSSAGTLDRFARADAVPGPGVALEQEITTSPVTGKRLLRVSIDRGPDIAEVNLEVDGARRIAAGPINSVYEMEAASVTLRLRYRQDDTEKLIDRNVHDVVAWPAASRRTKAAVLAAEWARGGDRQQIARLAREAGLDELADAVEKR